MVMYKIDMRGGVQKSNTRTDPKNRSVGQTQIIILLKNKWSCTKLIGGGSKTLSLGRTQSP